MSTWEEFSRASVLVAHLVQENPHPQVVFWPSPFSGEGAGSSWGLLYMCIVGMMRALSFFGWQAMLALLLPLVLRNQAHSFLTLLEMLRGTVRKNHSTALSPGKWSAECAELSVSMPTGNGPSLEDCWRGLGDFRKVAKMGLGPCSTGGLWRSHFSGSCELGLRATFGRVRHFTESHHMAMLVSWAYA